MKKIITPVVFMLTLLVAAPLFAAEESPVADYTIRPGDVLEISVWNNAALTKNVTVLPDGKFQFPLIGEVVAGGKTVAVLKQEVEEKIGIFVTDSNLSVMVQQVGSMMIYVIGKVNQPGRFMINANVNVLQSLAMAGGLNPFAKEHKIKIFRETGGATKIIKFDYGAVTDGKDLSQNVMLERGDVVVVP